MFFLKNKSRMYEVFVSEIKYFEKQPPRIIRMKAYTAEDAAFQTNL